MKLNQLYRALLGTAGLVETDGCVSIKIGKNTEPVLVKGKRLVLPTTEHLRNSDWSSRMVFHPLAENILHGESDVLAKYRKAINVRINVVITTFAYELLRIATSPAKHAGLSPDQSEFLSSLKHADEKTLEVFGKILDVVPVGDLQKNMVSIFLKRGGTVDGKKYARVGVVSFPLFTELTKKEDKDVYGVKLRVKDRDSLVALLRYMVPNIEVPHAYDRGSNSQIAPSLDALMQSVRGIASAINDMVELFRNQLDDPDDMLFNADWVEVFDNLGVMRSEIQSVPMQAGNEGIPAKMAEETPPATTAPAQSMFAAAPTPAPVNYPGGYQPHPTPVAPAQPVHTGRGLDFESVLRANPALQAQVYSNLGMSPMGAAQTQYQAQRVPTWARPVAAAPAPYGTATGWNAGGGGWAPTSGPTGRF